SDCDRAASHHLGGGGGAGRAHRSKAPRSTEVENHWGRCDFRGDDAGGRGGLMLQPKRFKHRKMQRGHRRGMAHSGNTVAFGEYGIQALEPAWITARQIEAARRAITHHMRRGGKVWIRIFPDRVVTAKP